MFSTKFVLKPVQLPIGSSRLEVTNQYCWSQRSVQPLSILCEVPAKFNYSTHFDTQGLLFPQQVDPEFG